jgi:hypothetical protein
MRLQREHRAAAGGCPYGAVASPINGPPHWRARPSAHPAGAARRTRCAPPAAPLPGAAGACLWRHGPAAGRRARAGGAARGRRLAGARVGRGRRRGANLHTARPADPATALARCQRVSRRSRTLSTTHPQAPQPAKPVASSAQPRKSCSGRPWRGRTRRVRMPKACMRGGGRGGRAIARHRLTHPTPQATPTPPGPRRRLRGALGRRRWAGRGGRARHGVAAGR